MIQRVSEVYFLFTQFARVGSVFKRGEVFGRGVREVGFLFLEGEMAEGVLEGSMDDGDVYGVGFSPLNEVFSDLFHD